MINILWMMRWAVKGKLLIVFNAKIATSKIVIIFFNVTYSWLGN